MGIISQFKQAWHGQTNIGPQPQAQPGIMSSRAVLYQGRPWLEVTRYDNSSTHFDPNDPAHHSAFDTLIDELVVDHSPEGWKAKLVFEDVVQQSMVMHGSPCQAQDIFMLASQKGNFFGARRMEDLTPPIGQWPTL